MQQFMASFYRRIFVVDERASEASEGDHSLLWGKSPPPLLIKYYNYVDNTRVQILGKSDEISNLRYKGPKSRKN